MITQWIEACEVQRVSLDGGLVLNLEDHNELVITRPLRLSIPALEAHPAEDLIVIRIDDQIFGWMPCRTISVRC